MSRIPVSSSSRAATVWLSRQLDEALHADDELSLDFTTFKSRNPAWGAVLSNVLAGTLENARKLSVQFPEAAEANVRLARSGLYFALARQRALDWAHLDDGTSATLARWTTDWRPANLQEPLFNLAGEHIDTDEPDRFDKRLVAFLNPDLAPREEAADDTAAVVYPWLRGLMRHRGVVDTADERRLHQAISLITWELLDNIREWSRMRPGQNCSLVTFATRGQPNQVHVCVMDTGIGIVESLRKRFEPLAETTDEDLDLVRRALTNQLPQRTNARGGGLPSVLDTLGGHKSGKFFLATGPTSDGGAIVAEVAGNHRDVIAPQHVAGLRMQGTVVLVTLPFGSPRPVRKAQETNEGIRNAPALSGRDPDSM